MPPERLSGGLWAGPGLSGRFLKDVGCHFGVSKSSKSELKFDQNSSTDLERHFWPFGGRFRLDFGTIWGAISGSRARDAKLAKIAPRHSESTIFGVPRPKRIKNGSETNFQRQPGSKSGLGASGARCWCILGSISSSQIDQQTIPKTI